MKVLLVNTSPKEKGSTYHVLEFIAQKLSENGVESEIFWTGQSVLGGCRGCMGCRKTGKCIIDDDAVNTLAQKANEADGFIFASPVHYAAASGNLTAALDRVFYSAAKNFAFKPGAAVAVARRAGCSATLDQIHKYFSINSMPIVPSTYWNMIHSSKPGDYVNDPEGMQTMTNLANNMAWMIRCIEAAKEQGIEHPVAIKEVRTDFNS
ncbi:MAG: flavodoxin family protein [Clostridia bacterium]|nr:flavodoxin family protein [Clostridia bacterium]